MKVHRVFSSNHKKVRIFTDNSVSLSR